MQYFSNFFFMHCSGIEKSWDKFTTIFSSCIAQALRSLGINLLLVKQLLVTSFVARILAHFVVYMCFAVVVYPSSV